jgi:hypothetical protein
MKITWHLDTEELLDAENLLGDITLTVGQRSLGERDTYIDSWLDALITGLKAVQAGQSTRIDIPEEPEPLIFEPVGKRVRVSYRTMMIELESVDELHSALRLAAQAFLQKLAAVEGGESNPLLRSIHDFVCHAQAIPDDWPVCGLRSPATRGTDEAGEPPGRVRL